MENIKSKIDDALFLWDNGRKESAFLLAVVCVAALSKHRYPSAKDGEAFIKTFRSFNSFTLSVEFRGKLESIEYIFYKWIRCSLIHEGEIPFDILIMEDANPESMSIRAGGYPEFTLKIGTGWFFLIINSILNVSEIKKQ